jgi:exosome complex RNA-binding protein Rrp42 (RNase PH superfamily)
VSEKVKVPLQRVHMDISQIKVLDEEGNAVILKKKSWIIRVDATGKKWSQFVDAKLGCIFRRNSGRNS